MHGLLKSLNGAAATAILAGGALVVSSGIVLAEGTKPKPAPRIDCSKPENQNKPACKNKNQELSDDELYYAGYWLARKGDYQLALHYLNQAQNKDDVRFLTYIGFATRKLGRMDEAMGFYARAIEVDPSYTPVRAYLGEAYLLRGERSKAEDQLAEIATRCGTTCDEYKELQQALSKARS